MVCLHLCVVTFFVSVCVSMDVSVCLRPCVRWPLSLWPLSLSLAHMLFWRVFVIHHVLNRANMCVIAVLCPEFSSGTDVSSGCSCNAGYSGSVTPTTVSPFYESTCTGLLMSTLCFDPSIHLISCCTVAMWCT